MNFRGRMRADPVGFQLAPMIDIVFLLLTFFMTSQLFAQWEEEVEITLPTAQTSEMQKRLPGEIILNVLADGTVVVNGQPRNDNQLASMLIRLTELSPGQPIVVRADKATSYEHIIRVLDHCRQADIWNISFATLMRDQNPRP